MMTICHFNYWSCTEHPPPSVHISINRRWFIKLVLWIRLLTTTFQYFCNEKLLLQGGVAILKDWLTLKAIFCMCQVQFASCKLIFIFYIQSTPWQDAKDLPQDSDRPWERREVIAPVSNSAAPVTRRNHPNTVPDNRRKSAPAQPRWNSQGGC